MRKLLVLPFVCILLTGCQTYYFSDEQPELSFIHLEPIPVKVHQILVENYYGKHPNYKKNAAYALADSPRETLENLIKTKIVPTVKAPSTSFLKFYIMGAQITQSEYPKKDIFEGTLKVHLEVSSEEALIKTYKDFEIYAVKETPNGLTLAERDEVIFALNEVLMHKFYVAFLKYKKLHLALL